MWTALLFQKYTSLSTVNKDFKLLSITVPQHVSIKIRLWIILYQALDYNILKVAVGVADLRLIKKKLLSTLGLGFGAEFPIISEMTLNIFLSFCTIYFYKISFSELTFKNSKFETALETIEYVFYPAVSNI